MGTVALATIMASVISARVPGASIYRFLWFLPAIAPVAAVGVFFGTAFQPRTGSINEDLRLPGPGFRPRMAVGSSTASTRRLPPPCGQSVGFAFLLMLGATEQVPVSLYEAARLRRGRGDQATCLDHLAFIRPTLTVVFLLQLILGFNAFTLLYAMTGGGPGGATQTLPILVYQQAFQLNNFGIANAMAIVGGVVLLVLGVVGLRFARSKQRSDDR